ncbi:mariner Mos1 transposase [Trichonephila clavipes]|nr:mariner Mos1 transposase [Trichonephila clavipes]
MVVCSISFLMWCDILSYGNIFWDSCGTILIDYLERGQAINADRCCATLTRLREAIQRKRPGILSEGVILLHDNTRPHIAQATQELLRRFRWEIWSHTPCSPDLAPSDYFLLSRLKEHLSGRRFPSDSAAKISTETWLNGQGPDFYQDGFNKLVLHADKCLNRHGDNVEK